MTTEHGTLEQRWSMVLAGLLALAASAAADGNVTAYVDSAGDLWAVGDDLDNGLWIGAGGDDTDTFLLQGVDATTTVNGQSRVTLVAPGTRIVVLLSGGDNVAWMGTDYGSNPHCCNRDLILLTGDGNDALHGVGPFYGLFADLGAGDDRVTWGEGASDVRRALIRTGDGADVIDIDTGVYTSRIEMGPGNDRLFVGWGTWDTQIDTEAGDDRITLYGGGRFDLQTGPGSDVVSLDVSGVSGQGYVTVGTSHGHDDVRITGNGYGAVPIDPLSIYLGPDDDHLEIGGAVIGTAVLDGGSGRDAYLDLGNRFVAGAPDLRSFELPKTTPAPAPAVPTSLAGRVVDEDGVPVGDAVVFVPELELLTATDADGRFAFDGVEDEHRTLAIVVGATLRGRSRSGATSVELFPLGISDAGDVVLEHDLLNVLVYGAPPAWAPDLAEVLESRFTDLGFRSVEVTHGIALPPDLSPYGVIWHLGSSVPAGERFRLAEFVRSGRGLHLSGGTPAQNAELETLVNQLVAGGGIDIGGSEVGGPYQFNPLAAGGVTRTPNVLTGFADSSFPRAITGLELHEVLFSGAAGRVPGAVWDSRDLVGARGRLTLIVSPFWIRGNYGPSVIENLQAFLQREPEGLRR